MPGKFKFELERMAGDSVVSQYCLCRDGMHSSHNCVAYDKVNEALHKYYKFNHFKPGQLEAILPVMHKKDTFVRMATGAGKSLCIFLPPLALSTTAIGIVISPLIGLMEQQVCSCMYVYS